MYYHDFVIGLNAWPCVLILLIAVMALLGAIRYGLDAKKRPHPVVSDRVYNTVAWTFTVLMEVLLFVESRYGILQFFLNRLRGTESPALAYAFTVLAFVVALGAFWFTLNLSAWCSSKITVERKRRK